MRRWGNRAVPREERIAFLEEITAGNLRRMLWFILICLPISLGIFIANRSSWHQGQIDLWGMFDIFLAFVFLGLTLLGRKRMGPLWWRRSLVLAYYVYCLIAMTGYYFAGLSRFGENQSYTLGVVMVSVLFRIPPREFFSLLLANHLVFSLLLWFSKTGSDRILVALLGGLDTLVVGCMAAHFLFAKEWQDFQNGRLLARRNREMEAANAQLKQHNEEMNEIMAIAAHDLRSPLFNVQGLFELLKVQEEWRREPYRNVLEQCGQAFDGMLGLIKRLLEAHAAEHGADVIEPRRIDAKGFVEERVGQFAAMAKARAVCLETELPGEEIEIETDPGALEQALDNLLANAIKFSPSGARVKVALFQKESVCCIEVADEGPGIPEKERGRLFRKFYKGRNRPRDGAPGAGLGLFIVWQVMMNLGGEVVQEPRPPHGSLFRLKLPLLGRAG